MSSKSGDLVQDKETKYAAFTNKNIVLRSVTEHVKADLTGFSLSGETRLDTPPQAGPQPRNRGWSAEVWLKEQGLLDPTRRRGEKLVCKAVPGTGQKCQVGAGIESLLVCSGCNSARYCSKGESASGSVTSVQPNPDPSYTGKDHQDADWERHKYHCWKRDTRQAPGVLETQPRQTEPRTGLISETGVDEHGTMIGTSGQPKDDT